MNDVIFETMDVQQTETPKRPSATFKIKRFPKKKHWRII